MCVCGRENMGQDRESQVRPGREKVRYRSNGRKTVVVVTVNVGVGNEKTKQQKQKKKSTVCCECFEEVEGGSRVVYDI